MAGTYKTPGRTRLLHFLQNHPDRQFSADELAIELDQPSEPPSALPAAPEKTSKSTLYRHLSELCREGSVRKYRSDTQSAYVYQYVGRGDCCHHFHLKCVECGALVHLECTVSETLLSHISTDHGFLVDSGRSILYGICEACATAQNARHTEWDERAERAEAAGLTESAEVADHAEHTEPAAREKPASRTEIFGHAEKKQPHTHPCGCPRCHH